MNIFKKSIGYNDNSRVVLDCDNYEKYSDSNLVCENNQPCATIKKCYSNFCNQ